MESNKCTRRNFLLGSIGLSATTQLLASTFTPKVPLELKKNALSSTSVDHLLLLRCIAEVETGNDDTKVGSKGERSRYQISEVVWRQQEQEIETDFGIVRLWRPFFFCSGINAERCALRHVQWLDNTIPHSSAMERSFREYVLAWAWHGGRDSWLSGRPSVRLNNYATRVANLYADLSKQVP